MSRGTKSTEFLKECMADALINLLSEKKLEKITADEITKAAGVGRATYFRNFDSKHSVLTFKLILLWQRFEKTKSLRKNGKRYETANAKDLFNFCYENKEIFRLIYNAGEQSVIYDAFYRILMPQFDADVRECYRSRFYSYGLFGLLDEWIKRDYKETPEELYKMFFAGLSRT
jgi:AcrR family transcriptional regulator